MSDDTWREMVVEIVRDNRGTSNPVVHALVGALDKYDRRGAELDRLRHERERVISVLRVESDDPVSAASFVREAADKFAARVAELQPIEQRAREMHDGVTDGSAFVPTRARERGIYDATRHILGEE